MPSEHGPYEPDFEPNEYPGPEEDEDESDERPRDTKLDEAKTELRRFFEAHLDGVYYMTQLKVLFEKSFFHWITNFALHELIDEGFLRTELFPLTSDTKIRFVTHSNNRYFRRDALTRIKLVRQFSEPRLLQAAGHYAGLLFQNMFALNGFTITSTNTKSFGDKSWGFSKHNLDFIMARDSITYGVEVKNTWDYIDRDELNTKLLICRLLGITPLFILRFGPKSYYWNLIRQAEGYWLLFATHIYPLGFEDLAPRIRSIFGLSADTPRQIPVSIEDRFLKHIHARLIQRTRQP